MKIENHPEAMRKREPSRVLRSKSQARRSYNRLSRWYDLLAGSSEEKYRAMGVQALGIQPGECVLEIGCGTGTSLASLASLVGPEGAAWGLDLSDGMATLALERIKVAGFYNRSRVCLGDGAWLPFRTGCFQAIFLSFTLELFDTPEIPQVLAGCRRVIAPDGRLGVVAMGMNQPPGLAERIYEWFHHRMPVLVDCRPIDGKSLVEAAGFKVRTEQRESMWGLPVVVFTAGV